MDLRTRIVISTKDQTRQGFKSTESGLDRLNNKISSVQRNLKNLFVAGLSAQLVKGVLDTADAYTDLEARLVNVTDSTEELNQVQESLFDSAQRTGTAYENNVALFSRLAVGVKAFGGETEDTLKLNEALTKSLIIGGATAKETASAQLQFAQAMASGTLAGDELKSIMEASERTSRALAEGLGVTVGELKKLGKEGKLTGKVVFDALISQSQTLDTEFAKIPTTIARAATQFSNVWGQYINDVNKGIGATKSIAGVISSAASNFDSLAEAVIKIAKIALVAYASRITVSIAQSIKLAAASRSAAKASALQAQQTLLVAKAEIRRTTAMIKGSTDIRTRKALLATLTAQQLTYRNALAATNATATKSISLFTRLQGVISKVFGVAIIAQFASEFLGSFTEVQVIINSLSASIEIFRLRLIQFTSKIRSSIIEDRIEIVKLQESAERVRIYSEARAASDKALLASVIEETQATLESVFSDNRIPDLINSALQLDPAKVQAQADQIANSIIFSLEKVRLSELDRINKSELAEKEKLLRIEQLNKEINSRKEAASKQADEILTNSFKKLGVEAGKTNKKISKGTAKNALAALAAAEAVTFWTKSYKSLKEATEAGLISSDDSIQAVKDGLLQLSTTGAKFASGIGKEMKVVSDTASDARKEIVEFSKGFDDLKDGFKESKEEAQELNKEVDQLDKEDIETKHTVESNTEQVAKQVDDLNKKDTKSDHNIKDNAKAALSNVLSLNNKNTSSTHTINIVRVERNSIGGPVGQFATGGFIRRFAEGGFNIRSGKLPGFGGGDKIRALLEAGEFIIRKEAVKLLGLNFFQQANQGQVPVKRKTGGIIGAVQRFATGGVVSSVSDDQLSKAISELRESIVEQTQESRFNGTPRVVTISSVLKRLKNSGGSGADSGFSGDVRGVLEDFNESVSKLGTDLEKSLSTAADAGREQIQRLDTAFNNAIVNIEKSRDSVSRNISDSIRDIIRSGLTEEEVYVDKIKEIREKQNELRESLARGDVESAERLNREIVAISADISREVVDAQGNIIVGQEDAATKAINFLKAAEADNKRIANTKKSQTTLQFNSDVANQNALNIQIINDINAQHVLRLRNIQIEKNQRLQALAEENRARGSSGTSGGGGSSSSPFGRGSIIGSRIANGLSGAGGQYADVPFNQLPRAIRNGIFQNTRLRDRGVNIGNARTIDFSFNTSKSSGSDFLDGLINNAKGNLRFALGGLVPGSGNQDNVFARLTPKEFVVKPSGVKKYGTGFLNAINQGILPKNITSNSSDNANSSQSSAPGITLNLSLNGQTGVAEVQDGSDGFIDELKQLALTA